MTTHRATTVRRSLLTLALVAVAAGVVLLVIGLRGQESAPQPPRSLGQIDPPSGSASPGGNASTPAASTGSSTGSSGSPSSSPVAEAEAPPLGPSRPTRIRIPAIGVDTVVNPIGKDAQGALAVPQPGPLLNQAAWYNASPTPGQPGPSIIEGHVDSVEGPSVFFKLGAVRPGNKLIVTRADGVVATFTVDAIRDFAKSSFPTNLVYGGDLSRASLRLITCSDFDTALRTHVGNEVVFSHLTHVSGAPS